MNENSPIIEIKNLSKVFQSKTGKVEALEGIDLTINHGDIYGIIGSSGAGKSTLVRCINFLEKPTGGTVFFDGQDLSKLSEAELNKARRSMGMIFQQFNLLTQRNALDNICFPLRLAGTNKEEARRRALELLEVVGMSEKAKAYPSQLSGGQKQRVAIARALATSPKVLLCDEATSALDPATTRSVLALLKEINAKLGITIIIITHEMSVVAEVCKKVAIIDEHRIAESGSVSEIFTSPKSPAGCRLVYPAEKPVEYVIGGRMCRIVFDGNSSFEPVISDMILECKAPVNIMFADTRDIEGKAYGQMVLQLPEDEEMAGKLIAHLRSRNISVEEVTDHV